MATKQATAKTTDTTGRAQIKIQGKMNLTYAMTESLGIMMRTAKRKTADTKGRPLTNRMFAMMPPK